MVEIEAKVAAFAEEINLAVDTEDYELAETLEAERSAMEATLAIFKAQLPEVAAEEAAATGADSGFSFVEPAAHERVDSGFSFVEPAVAPAPAALAAEEVGDAEGDVVTRGRTESGFEFAEPAVPSVAEEPAPHVAADEPDLSGIGGAGDETEVSAAEEPVSAFAFVAAEEPDLSGIGGDETEVPAAEEPASAFAFVETEEPGVAAADEPASAFSFVAAEESGAKTGTAAENAAANADPYGADDFEEGEERKEANAAGAAAAAAAEELHFEKGETVLYVSDKETGETVEAEIMRVHIDDPEEKYYTIVCMGREKQTVGSRMRRRTAAEDEKVAAIAGAAGAEGMEEEEMPDLSGIGAPDVSAEAVPVSAFGFVAADAAAEVAPVSAFGFVAAAPVSAPAPAADAAAEAVAAVEPDAEPAAAATASGFGFM